jgi:hypothetical protein
MEAFAELARLYFLHMVGSSGIQPCVDWAADRLVHDRDGGDADIAVLAMAKDADEALPLIEGILARYGMEVPPRGKRGVWAARLEIVRTARALISKDIPFLEGVRKLVALRNAIPREKNDADFNLFVGIDSASDHIPGIAQRPLCAESWLQQCDQEVRELEQRCESDIAATCARLIGRFSQEPWATALRKPV